MRTLLIVATRKEIQPLLTELQVNKVEEDLYHTTFIHLGELDILITGIGIPFAMYHLMNTLSLKKYNLVINAGVCGSFHEDLKIGTLVNVAQEEFADIGIQDRKMFYTFFEKNWIDLDMTPFKKGKLVNEYLPFEGLKKLRQVKSITVNTCHGDEESINIFRKKFSPDVENMEGAAIFYICLQKQIPFAEIRCISNMVEDRDITKWDLPTSIQNLNQYLIETFNILNKKAK